MGTTNNSNKTNDTNGKNNNEDDAGRVVNNKEVGGEEHHQRKQHNNQYQQHRNNHYQKHYNNNNYNNNNYHRGGSQQYYNNHKNQQRHYSSSNNENDDQHDNYHQRKNYHHHNNNQYHYNKNKNYHNNENNNNNNQEDQETEQHGGRGSGGTAGGTRPQPIAGNAGTHIQLYLGDTGDEYILCFDLVDNKNPNHVWQARTWNGHYRYGYENKNKTGSGGGGTSDGGGDHDNNQQLNPQFKKHLHSNHNRLIDFSYRYMDGAWYVRTRHDNKMFWHVGDNAGSSTNDKKNSNKHSPPTKNNTTEDDNDKSSSAIDRTIRDTIQEATDKGIDRIMVSYSMDNADTAVIIYGDNGYHFIGGDDNNSIPTGLKAYVRKTNALKGKIRSVRFLPNGGGYFVSTTNGFKNYNIVHDHKLRLEIGRKVTYDATNTDDEDDNDGNNQKKNIVNDEVVDVCVANDGSWIVLRAHSFVVSEDNGISSTLLSKLSEFYENFNSRQMKRDYEIQQFKSNQEQEYSPRNNYHYQRKQQEQGQTHQQRSPSAGGRATYHNNYKADGHANHNKSVAMSKVNNSSSKNNNSNAKFSSNNYYDNFNNDDDDEETNEDVATNENDVDSNAKTDDDDYDEDNEGEDYEGADDNGGGENEAGFHGNKDPPVVYDNDDNQDTQKEEKVEELVAAHNDRASSKGKGVAAATAAIAGSEEMIKRETTMIDRRNVLERLHVIKSKKLAVGDEVSIIGMGSSGSKKYNDHTINDISSSEKVGHVHVVMKKKTEKKSVEPDLVYLNKNIKKNRLYQQQKAYITKLLCRDNDDGDKYRTCVLLVNLPESLTSSGGSSGDANLHHQQYDADSGRIRDADSSSSVLLYPLLEHRGEMIPHDSYHCVEKIDVLSLRRIVREFGEDRKQRAEILQERVKLLSDGGDMMTLKKEIEVLKLCQLMDDMAKKLYEIVRNSMAAKDLSTGVDNDDDDVLVHDKRGCFVHRVLYEHQGTSCHGPLYAIGKKDGQDVNGRPITLQALPREIRNAIIGPYAHEILFEDHPLHILCSLAQQLQLEQLIPSMIDYRDHRTRYTPMIRRNALVAYKKKSKNDNNDETKITDRLCKLLPTIIICGGDYKTWLKVMMDRLDDRSSIDEHDEEKEAHNDNFDEDDFDDADDELKQFLFNIQLETRALRDKLFKHPRLRWLDADREKIKEKNKMTNGDDYDDDMINDMLLLRLIKSCENEVLNIVHRILHDHRWKVRVKLFDSLIVEPNVRNDGNKMQHGGGQHSTAAAGNNVMLPTTITMKKMMEITERICLQHHSWNIKLIDETYQERQKQLKEKGNRVDDNDDGEQPLLQALISARSVIASNKK